jgi:2-oxoacid dehydrogenase-like protein with E3 subunit-binding domain
MAQKTTKSQRSSNRRDQNASSRDGKGSRGGNSQGRGGKRPALEARRKLNDADLEYRRYIQHEEQDPAGPPDVLLDVPELRVDSIHFELDDLDAHVALKAKVLNLVKLNVGVDVHLSRVKLDIKGVEAQVVLKARLDHVTAIVDRLMTSLDRNPELVKGLSRAVSEVGQGAGEAVDKTGDAAKDIGRGAQGALKDVGKGAGEATGDIGEGAGQAVGDVGQGAGQAVGDIGQGTGQAVGDVGQGAGQAAGNLDQLVGGVGQTVGQAGQGATQALGGLGQGAGQLPAQPDGQGAGQAPSQADGGQPNGGAPQAATSGALAKEVAKMVAREIGHAASDEARDLGLAATRKVRELGERREQRRADKYHATEAAIRMADELGIDLTRLDGTGSEGRITVKDVREAQEA